MPPGPLKLGASRVESVATRDLWVYRVVRGTRYSNIPGMLRERGREKEREGGREGGNENERERERDVELAFPQWIGPNMMNTTVVLQSPFDSWMHFERVNAL